MKNIILLMALSLCLSACKIDLSIFGKGSVATTSGSFDCTSDGTTQSGDCTQTYNFDPDPEVQENCNPEDEDCTLITEGNSVTETWIATPEEDGTFDGFDDHCVGAGFCEHTITYAHANAPNDPSTIEAHFEPEQADPVSYTYNHKGQIASMTVDSVTTYYLYDLSGNRTHEINASGETLKTYVYAENDMIMWVENSGDTGNSETEEQVFYPINNHLGQPEVVLRADLEPSHEQFADPFGKLHAMYINRDVGVDDVGPLPVTNSLPGQWLQPSGYVYNWNRYYDPSIGAYPTPDPIGILYDYSLSPELNVSNSTNDPADFAWDYVYYSSMSAIASAGIFDESEVFDGGINHLYGYVDQNPVNYIDPDGLEKMKTHRKNQRPSNLPKHQKGEARKNRDAHKEKGDNKTRLKYFLRMRPLITPLEPSLLFPDPCPAGWYFDGCTCVAVPSYA